MTFTWHLTFELHIGRAHDRSATYLVIVRFCSKNLHHNVISNVPFLDNNNIVDVHGIRL